MTEKQSKTSISVMIFKKELQDDDKLRYLEQKRGFGRDPYAKHPLKKAQMGYDVNQPYLIAEWLYSLVGEGRFNVLPWRWHKGKNRKNFIAYGKKLFEVELYINENGILEYHFYSLKGLRTYGFWKNPLIPKDESIFFDEEDFPNIDTEWY